MKKSAKLFSIITSLVISSITVINTVANASVLFDTGYIDNTKYERCTEIEEYFNFNSDPTRITKVYRSIEMLDTGYYHYIAGTDYSGMEDYKGNGVYYGTFRFYFEYYELSSEEDCIAIVNCMTERYPQVLAEYEKDGTMWMCVLKYDDDVSTEEKFEIAKAIKNSTGLISYSAKEESNLQLKYVGDLSSDNALTPVDASMLLSYYADAQSGVAVASAKSGVDYSIIGDFNGDGAVTPSDASEILSYYADQQTA